MFAIKSFIFSHLKINRKMRCYFLFFLFLLLGGRFLVVLTLLALPLGFAFGKADLRSDKNINSKIIAAMMEIGLKKVAGITQPPVKPRTKVLML